jgi:HD-GYP domain-containing protein (c-di-GMP phosphodiesterase class II)
MEKKLLPISELRVGMISASDINYKDKILLAEGVVITERNLSKLKQNYIVDKVEVYLEQDSTESLDHITNSLEEINSTFNKFSLNLEDILSNISNLKDVKLNEIRSFSKRLQEEFKATGLVIKNIVFYGSGDDTIYRHSVNVAAISYILGKWLGLNENELNLLIYSALLHDFGKTKIDDNIINKRDKLTSEEYATLSTHPVIAYNLIKKIPFLDASVGYGVLMHHERMDGSGYPLGIKGDKIHKFAKIIAIADLFDEVSSNRYIEKVSGPFEALQIIQKAGLGKLDCIYCNMFLNHVVNYYMGENVLLNNKQTCKIIQIHMNDLTKPLLLDNGLFLDLQKEKNLYVESFVI